MEDVLRMKPIAEQDPLADRIVVVKNLRSSFAMDNIIPKPSQCQINNETFEYDGHSVHTYWIDYPTRKFQGKSDKLLLYFHGGGYVLGDIHSKRFKFSILKSIFYFLIGYSGIECHLSELFNVSILHVEYRLSPEHPLPAAVDDAVAIYRALLRRDISPSQLLFMGDSAGGGLTLLTVQALLARQLPVPRGIIVLSPWTDVSISGESYTRNAKIDVMLSAEGTKFLVPVLLDPKNANLTLNNPMLSPLFGSFEGFPPMYVTVGTAEIVEDDSRGVVKKAQQAGVDVTFEEGLHLMHVYPLFFTYFPEARNTLDNINQWIQTIFQEK
jgi:acetyl esterase/lipase